MTFVTVLKITQMKDCPSETAEGRYEHSIVAYENSFYIFGGCQGSYDEGNFLNDLIKYHVKTQSWSKIIGSGTPPTPRCDHSAVVYRSSMFVFGGCIGNKKYSNDLYEYRFKAKLWTQFRFQNGILPEPRQGHVAAVYDDQMWIFSGFKNSKINDMWKIRLWGDANEWTRINQNGVFDLQLVHNCPMAVVGDRMYILGTGTKVNRIRFFVFNFKDYQWSKLKDPLSYKKPYAMGVFGERLIVFGKSIEALYCYDLNSQAWSDMIEDSESVVRLKVFGYPTVFFEDALYAFGGELHDTNSYSSALYKVELKRKYDKFFIDEDYEKILETGLFTDMDFVVGENEIKIPAHIAIVAARSELLRTRIREKSILSKALPMLQLKIPNARPEVFEMMLKYIYTDRIDPKKETLLLYLDLYSLAAEIRLKNLETLIVKQLSDQFLEKSITSSNVLSVLSKANNIGLLVIKEYCLSFMVNDVNCMNLIENVEFETLDNSLLVEIIRKIKNPASQILSSQENLDSDHPSLAQDMEAFLNSVGEKFSDVTLLVGQYSIPAHKCVLAARSSYFEALFRSFMPPHNIIHIKIGEIIPSKEAFDVLLKYIYYNDLNIPIEHSFILWFAADFYGFKSNRLQEAIKTNLKGNGTFEQIVRMLEEAHLAQQTDLKHFLLELIVELCPNFSSWSKTHTLTQELWVEIVNAMSMMY